MKLTHRCTRCFHIGEQSPSATANVISYLALASNCEIQTMQTGVNYCEGDRNLLGVGKAETLQHGEAPDRKNSLV